MKNSMHRNDHGKKWIILALLAVILVGIFLILNNVKKPTDEEAAKATVLAYFDAINREDAHAGNELCTDYFKGSDGVHVGDYTYEIVDITYEPESSIYAVVRQRMMWNGYEDSEWIYLQISFRPHKIEGGQGDYFNDGYLYEEYGVWLLREKETGEWKISDMGY